MRLLTRVAIGFGVLVLAAFVLLVFALPRLVAGDAVRARIEQEGREASGREVRYGELSFGWLPPRLRVQNVHVAGPAPGAPAFLEAESIDLVLALLPLLARTLVVDSLAVEGATLHVTRSAEGFDLPRPVDEKETDPDPESKRADAEQEQGGLTLAVREARLQGVRVTLEDRTVSPPISWEIDELAGRFEAIASDQPVRFQARGELASGGSFEAEGAAELAGGVEGEVRLDSFSVEPLGSYLDLEDGGPLLGTLSGTLRGRRHSSKDAHLKADLVLDDGKLRIEDVGLSGRVEIVAELDGDLRSPSGDFELDATAAEVGYAGAFEKPPGTPATLSGRLVPGANGDVEIEELKLDIRNLDVEGRLGLRHGGVASELHLAAFDLDGWEALIPALSTASPTGRVGPGPVALATSPLHVVGEIPLSAVELAPREGLRVRLDGVLEGIGAEVRSRDLMARMADQPFSVNASVTDLPGDPTARLALRGRDVDTKLLIEALGDSDSRLEGPLDLDTDLRLPLSAAEPLEATTGTVRLDIRPGKLRGISLLEKTFEGMGTVGHGALLAGRLEGGKTLQRFYGDEFESLTGTLELRAGVAHTDDLSLVYRNYTVDLRGSVGLRDERMDLTGTLTIDEEIDATLSNSEPGQEGTRSRKRRQVIRLARVGGTIDSPRVELTEEAVLTFASLYATGRRREKWERKIDERLGEGSGEAVLDVLDQILSGESRKE